MPRMLCQTGLETGDETRNCNRLLLSALYHVDETHLVYNMVSLLWKGAQLEPLMGTLPFLRCVAELLLLTQGTIVATSFLLARFAHVYGPYYQDCAVGFSGVLFALKVVLGHKLPHQRPYQVYGIPVAPRYAAWAELALIQLMLPNVSFLGHLSGILAGLMYVHGFPAIAAAWKWGAVRAGRRPGRPSRPQHGHGHPGIGSGFIRATSQWWRSLFAAPPPPPQRQRHGWGRAQADQHEGGYHEGESMEGPRTPTREAWARLGPAWTCEICTLDNVPGTDVCEACGNPKGSRPAGGVQREAGANSRADQPAGVGYSFDDRDVHAGVQREPNFYPPRSRVEGAPRSEQVPPQPVQTPAQLGLEELRQQRIARFEASGNGRGSSSHGSRGQRGR
eukprot:jgi/Mesvir1/21375/Mv20859-RA.1